MMPLLFEPRLLAMSYPPIRVYILLVLAALAGGFALLVIVVGMCERQHLTGDVEPAPYPYPPSAYWEATRRDAVKLGLRHAGDFATKKNTSMVKGLQSMFVTTDNQVIVSIIGGSLVGTKLKKTILRSKFYNGRIVESCDNLGGTTDFSGVVERKMLLHAGLVELLDFHLGRLRSAGLPPMTFNPQTVLEEYDKMDLERGERWVLLGLARWVDPQKTSIRLTFRGALRQVRNMFAEISKLKSQEHRKAIKRAGSRPGD